MTPDDFFDLAKKNKAEMVDLKFVDMLGSWQHCSFPIDHLDKNTFKDGLGFDGSSIRGWMGIHESDMLAVPDADTARIDPFFSKPTVSVIADIVDPVSGEQFTRDPRNVARKAENPFPSFRDLKSNSLRTRIDCSAAKRDLGWQPVSDRQEFIAKAILPHIKAVTPGDLRIA